MKINKKGFGLVMAVMIVLILSIMAAGFFQITGYSTEKVNRDMRNLRLYWAAESASNYNVNWWINQPDEVRKTWPALYTAPNSKGAVYQDMGGIRISETALPGAAGITKDGFLYLHASSLVEGNTNATNPELENFDGFKLVTTRYKGERKNKNGQAVWVLDSYAWDPNTGEMVNITLSNVFNIKIVGGVPLLANSEVIISSLAGTGFNGAKGAFHEKDVRYGPCYFADLIRLDRQTGGSKGPRFYVGPVTSSALAAGSPLAQSRYGNPVETSKKTIATTNTFGYGIAMRSNSKNEAAAIGLIQESIKGTYIKDAPALSTDGTIWSWQDVETTGPAKGAYFLDTNGFPTGGNVSVELVYNAGSKTTVAKVSTGGVTKNIPLGKGGGNYNAVVVRKNYGTVSLKGVSNQDFSLITENSTVKLVDDFYAAEMQTTKDWFDGQSAVSTEQYNTDVNILRKLWEDMGVKTSDDKFVNQTNLSVISCLNEEVAPQGDSYSLEPAARIFSTAAYVTWDGFLNCDNRTKADAKIFNIGSVMTLDLQAADGGDPSAKWTKALIQDQRYLDPDFDIPPYWGPGPSDVDPAESTDGLNAQHRWNKNTFSDVSDWRSVVWRNGTP
jgi:hypothetical protein